MRFPGASRRPFLLFDRWEQFAHRIASMAPMESLKVEHFVKNPPELSALQPAGFCPEFGENKLYFNAILQT